MTSSFGGLNTAYTGLVAARQGLTVVGDNISNSTTVGYSRQEVTTSSLTPASESGFVNPLQVGDGVSVNAVTPGHQRARGCAGAGECGGRRLCPGDRDPADHDRGRT